MDLGLPAEYLPPLVCLHLVVSACAAGAVWALHAIHYPLMRSVPPDRFAAFMEEHLSRFTRWLAPLMVFEIGLAINLALFGSFAGIANLVVLASAWIISFYLRPVYLQLTEGYKHDLLERLIRLNRYRTLLWLAHFGLAVYIAAKTLA